MARFLSADSVQFFIRQVLLGPDRRGIANSDDIRVTLVINDNSLMYSFVDTLPNANDVGPAAHNANVLLRIQRDPAWLDRDWVGTPAMESLITWPVKYPLTSICRRLRKVGWIVNKTAQGAASLSFGNAEYVKEEYQLPMLCFDFHGLLAQMLLERGPKIRGMVSVVRAWAIWLMDPSSNPTTRNRPITDDFPEILVKDVQDCERWMLEFRNELKVLRGRVSAAQATPTNESLVHHVEGYPNSIPRSGKFPIDSFEEWDSASDIELFFGIHHWHQKWPNSDASERSYDYCWALWRVEEAAYLLEVLDDPRFNDMIDMWGQIYTCLQDIASNRADIRQTQAHGGPDKMDEINDMMADIKASAKTMFELTRSNALTLQNILGPPNACPPRVVRLTTPDQLRDWVEGYYNLPAPIPSLQDLSPITPAVREALEGASGMTMIG